MRNSRTIFSALILMISWNGISTGKLDSKKAEVSFYNSKSKLVKSDFEYYVKANNVQYGVRVGVDVFKVNLISAIVCINTAG